MDCTDSKSVGSHVESAEYVLGSHFAAVLQVQTSAVVLSSPGEDQERKIDTCALASGSGRRSELEPKKDTSTTTAHSTELPTTEATTSRGGVEPMSSGSARKREWTETLPEEENPSGEEMSVNEEDEQAMTRGGVEPMYSGSAPKRQCTETLPEEEDPSGEETSDDEDREVTTSGEDPSSEEDEEATTSGGVKPICYSGSAPEYLWSELLPAKEEDPSGAETSVNEEDEEATTSGGVKPIYYSGSAPEYVWSELLPAKEEDPSGAETSVNEEDEDCFVRAIHPSELEIVKEIAQGGQAKVFLAKYLTTQQDVVVKTYTCRGVNPGELRRQMESVMRACENEFSGFSGLCQVIGVSVDEKGRVSTVMELMGGDLRNFIDRCNPLLSYGDRLGLMKGIARGIKELHGYGIIHKDLKASNILVSPYRLRGRRTRSLEWVFNIKIGDYESSDGIAGTGFWRAPEVLKALRDGTKVEYSAAVDVYGFGMVCYELLSCQIPFQGHPLSDYNLVLSGGRPELPHNVTPTMKELLHRCWHMDPNQRPDWDEIHNILKLEKDFTQGASHDPGPGTFLAHAFQDMDGEPGNFTVSEGHGTH